MLPYFDPSLLKKSSQLFSQLMITKARGRMVMEASFSKERGVLWDRRSMMPYWISSPVVNYLARWVDHYYLKGTSIWQHTPSANSSWHRRKLLKTKARIISGIDITNNIWLHAFSGLLSIFWVQLVERQHPSGFMVSHCMGQA